jgi:hypothetical protein
MLLTKESIVKSVDIPWAGSGKRHTYLFQKCAIDLILAIIKPNKNCYFFYDVVLELSTE